MWRASPRTIGLLASGFALAILAGLSACAPSNPTSQNAGPGSDPPQSGGALPETEHVSAAGSYQTRFEIAVPPAPGAPRVSLEYDSHVNSTLAGTGWDLSVGYPMAIARDVRFGTPQWTRGSAWVLGTTPLIPSNEPGCNLDPASATLSGDCRYEFRTAPDTLGSVEIVMAAGREAASAHLANGSTLEYEPILYDGAAFPPAPAGAETKLFGFRLSSVVDRNGYRICFYYKAAPSAAPTLGVIDPNSHWGEATVLERVAYGPRPDAGDCTSSAFAAGHHINFQYMNLAPEYFHTWTMRFGAPVTFNSLLYEIDVYAAGATSPQDAFSLSFAGSDSEMHRPLLTQISQTVPLQPSRVLRVFSYGKRNLQFGDVSVVELGTGAFPESLAGSISRPVRHQNLLNDAFGLFQRGWDQVSDASPWVHATTQQWMFADINGDGLPDIQWGDETGTNQTWTTFETSNSSTPRPAQQKVLINEGLVGARLATTSTDINSHANSGDAHSLETLYPSWPEKGPDAGFTPWYWGEGRGETRTGMPISVSAPEIARVITACTPVILKPGTDLRIWPVYPDGTFGGSQGSTGDPVAQANPFPPGGNMYIGNVAVQAAIGIFDAYQPTYAVSSTVSGWMDLDGDGIPEFVVTPSWIERFTIDPNCQSLGALASLRTADFFGARIPKPATQSGAVDTDWHVGTFAASSVGIMLQRQSGPMAPIGVPLSYDISTGSAEGFGFSLPIGSLLSVGAETAACMCWMPIAAAAPGLTIETFSPRTSAGLTIYRPSPSGTQLLQSLNSGLSMVSSLAHMSIDLTVQSATSRNRTETRAQLIDINGDGLPDYLIYNSGPHTDANDPLMGVTRGSLVVFFNSSTGFGNATVINNGFDYPTLTDAAGLPTTLDDIITKIKMNLKTATDVDSGLVWNPIIGPPPDDPPGGTSEKDRMIEVMAIGAPLGDPVTAPDAADTFCKTRAVFPITWMESCAFYGDRLVKLAQLADDSVAAVRPFYDATTDAIHAERARLDEIAAMAGVLRAEATALKTPTGVVAAATVGAMDTTTAVADTLTEALGLLSQSLLQLAHRSRINAVNRAFSELDSAGLDEYAKGVAAQMRGFIDLNGDGLPDYVVADDRQSNCPVGQWEVFWGTGNSSISAQRAFDQASSCLLVPALPSKLSINDGVDFKTLPLSLDHVNRSPEKIDFNKPVRADTVVDSLVSLIDVNGDGRPDIVMAIDDDHPWNRFSGEGTVQVSTDTAEQQRIKRLRTWHVFLNNGAGFESQSVDITSPSDTRTDVVAVNAAPASGLDDNLDVQYPMIRTTLSLNDQKQGGTVRDRSDTTAGLLDIDGDGVLDAVRRVRLNDPDPTKSPTEALLVWRRANAGGPQDLVIEDRDPIKGSRTLVEYRPAVNFQWKDATPDGSPPLLGHAPIMGVARQLVYSVTNERLLGRDEQRTRTGYDYKLPNFDVRGRVSLGFAVRSKFALDPLTVQPVAASVASVSRSAQRPSGLPGNTQSRLVVRGTGAPIRETLTSYAESDPTVSAVGAGGWTSIFSAPSRTFVVEYPSSLGKGAIFDVGFDGLDPWRDRAGGLAPQMPSSACQDFATFLTSAPKTSETVDGMKTAVATGGAATFSTSTLPVQCSGTAFALSYPLPAYPSGSPIASGMPVPISALAVETWIKPDTPAGDQIVVDQNGAFRLSIVKGPDAFHWQFMVGGSFTVTSSGPDDLLPEHWQHVVATFGASGAKIFVNGKIVGDAAASLMPPQTSSSLFVGCGFQVTGPPIQCFSGELGELRFYPEYWQTAVRVSDREIALSLPVGCTIGACPIEFGQPLTIFDRNDMSTTTDDVATVFKYAAPDPAANVKSPIFGVVASEAKQVLQADGTLGAFLSYIEHTYDGRPFQLVSAGNETRQASFDGLAQVQQPNSAALHVTTATTYDSNCPGRVATVTDPLGKVTTTSWDATCTFALSVTNALNQTSRTKYYGVDDPLFPQIAPRSGPYGIFALQGHYGALAAEVDANNALTVSSYDDWGRLVAAWSPLDRVDRPKVQMAYDDAACEKPQGTTSILVTADCTDRDYSLLHLKSPTRVTTLNWDDQLRRCVDSSGGITSCSKSDAVDFAQETATGGYKTSYAFGDGQIQHQTVNNKKPGWSVRGIVDYDALGRFARAYKIQYLPQACPADGTWCDGGKFSTDPLRTHVAMIQIAYDVRGRAIRTYGPGWPLCQGGTSATTLDANGQPTSNLVCDSLATPPAVNDVTKFSYPAPGDILTIDAKNIPTLEHRDTRGLVTLVQEYMSPSATTQPLAYSAVASTYDQLGRLTGITDQNGNTSLNTYDALSRLVSATDPDRGLTTYQYDLRSQVTDRIVASGEKTHHEYDALGRVTQTDYLRPVQVPANSSTATNPQTGGPFGTIHFPPNCNIVAGLKEPTWWGHGPGWPDPPELQQLTLDGGAAAIDLPFDVGIRTVSQLPGADGSALRFEERDYAFARGTAVFITSGSQINLGGRPRETVATRAGAGATFNVIASDFVARTDGVRYGVAGPEGSRRLVIEWRGALAKRPNEPVIVRATVTEGNSIVRYDYLRVPANFAPGGGLHLADGKSEYDRGFEPGAGGSALVGPGGSFSFGGTTDAAVFGVACTGLPAEAIQFPFLAGTADNATLNLSYRVFSDCDAPDNRNETAGNRNACAGDLLISYRDTDDKASATHPLTRAHYAARALGRTNNLAREVPVAARLLLPRELHGKKLDILIDPQPANRKVLNPKARYVFGFIWSNPTTTTVYLPEERVHRTYDSSEPPYYFDEVSGKRREVRPVLDLTFDMFDLRGVPIDRSPTNASFDAASCSPATLPANMIVGASGKGLVLPAGTSCKGTIASASAARLSAFTLEMWVRPDACPFGRPAPGQPPPAGSSFCPEQAIFSTGKIALKLMVDGRLGDDSGTGTAVAASDDPLPTDSWTHVAIIDDGKSPWLAVNGVTQQTTGLSTGAPLVLSSLQLGDATSLSSSPVAVAIDEVRIIDATRTADHVHADALRPLAVGPPRGNLVSIDFDHPGGGGLIDQSKAQNNATAANGKLVPGIIGMVFDTRANRPIVITGSLPPPTGQVTVNHSPTLQLSNAVTAEVWIKTTSTQTGSARLIGKWAGPTTPGWRLEIMLSGRLRWEVVTSPTKCSVFITQEKVKDLAWHHVAATYDGRRMRVFRDGLPRHRWCGSGPREGAQLDDPDIDNCTTPPAPAVDCTAIENATLTDVYPANKHVTVGDAECISGNIDNAKPVLVADDDENNAFDGFVDEVRVSNYAKREFEVSASARLPSAFTQSLGRQTILRNRFIWRDGSQVDADENDQPHDLSQQPARELRAFDIEGHAISGVKHVLNQRSSDDYFVRRVASDAAGRNGLIEYPHGEVLVAQSDFDGTQAALTGYGPGLGQATSSMSTLPCYPRPPPASPSHRSTSAAGRRRSPGARRHYFTETAWLRRGVTIPARRRREQRRRRAAPSAPIVFTRPPSRIPLAQRSAIASTNGTLLATSSTSTTTRLAWETPSTTRPTATTVCVALPPRP